MNLSRFTRILLFLNFWAIVAAAEEVTPKSTEPTPLTLRDGIYAVLQLEEDSNAIVADKNKQRVVKYVRERSWGDTKSSINYLLVKSEPDVRIRLAKEPKMVQSDGQQCLNVRLVADGATSLRRFSEEQIDKKAAVVVNGKVVFVATIRSPIKTADLQISFCGGDGAEDLKAKLMSMSTKQIREESSTNVGD